MGNLDPDQQAAGWMPTESSNRLAGSMKVRKLPVVLVALLVLIVFQSGSIEAQITKSPRARFNLYNACRPMGLRVWASPGSRAPDDDASEISRWLGDHRRFNDRFHVAAESRLRAARLYADLSNDAETHGAFLYIGVNVVGPAMCLRVEYVKRLKDPVSGETFPAGTWMESSTGTYGGDDGFIVQSVSELLDKFLVEYLRVNEEACGSR